ncbi:MAG: SsrA-binding protein SmpB [Clostridiales bacterium]|nr:SsrA-binding protein SmpB [Clostridiales bacterium]
MSDKKLFKLIAQNKSAHFNYFIEETFQAGIELSGTEVKSLRQGRCNLKDAYVKIRGSEAYIFNMHISPYEQGNIFNRDPLRDRKLLLHKYEIRRLLGAAAREGATLIPVKIYFSGSLVKMDLAIAKGKKLYDKRGDMASKDSRREAERDFKVKIRT